MRAMSLPAGPRGQERKALARHPSQNHNSVIRLLGKAGKSLERPDCGEWEPGKVLKL
jgi:hypothetical protein